MAYTYPIGIPAAWIDPDAARPARPDPWTSDQAGYYYVEPTFGGATDTGRTYGNPTAPRATIPNPVPAGSYVEVKGAYAANDGGYTRIVGAGTSAAWVANTSGPAWVVGLDASNMVEFSAGVNVAGQYLYVEYFKVTATAGILINTTAAERTYLCDHILVRNCELDGSDTTWPGIVIVGSTYSGASYILCYNNHIHNTSPTTFTGDPDRIGFFAGEGAEVGKENHHIWGLGNTLADINQGGGMMISAGDGDPILVDHVYYGFNTVDRALSYGMGFKGSDHVIFSQNTIRNTVFNPDNAGSAAKGIGGQYGAKETWIIYNKISGCDYGVRLGSTDGLQSTIYIIGNQFLDCLEVDGIDYGYSTTNGRAPCAINLIGGEYRVVIGNTIQNCERGFATEGGAALGRDLIIENNIFSDVLFQAVLIPGDVADTIIRNNLCFQTSGSAEYRLGSTSYTTATVNSTFATASGNIEGDPDFLSSSNLALQSTSPAIDAALAAATLTDNVYAAFLSTYGVSIAKDITGGARPWDSVLDEAGGNWDIGAYEYLAEISDAVAPSNTVLPSISGITAIFQTLTASSGSWFAIPSATYTYQWNNNGSPISGATSSTYDVQAGDQGDTLTVTVTATNSEGFASATSAATSAITGLPVPTFSVSRHITPNSPT